MALRDLTSSEMLHFTGPWLEAGSLERVTIQRFPMLDGMVPKIERAHRALDQASRPEGGGDSQVRALGERMQALGERHDRAARSAWAFVNGASGLLDPERAEALGQIRDFLFPGGLAQATSTTFRGKSGECEQIADRLTPERRALLAGFGVAEAVPPGGPTPAATSLLDVVEQWTGAGQELGVLVRERDRLEAEAARLRGENEQEARVEWIRAINALRTATELEELEGRDRDVVLGPLDGAIAMANRRSQRRRGARAAAPTPGTPTPGTPTPGAPGSGNAPGSGGASPGTPATSGATATPSGTGSALPVVAPALPMPTPTAPAGGARAP